MPVRLPSAPAGVILAGGRGSRMGGTDKPLLRLAGKPIIEHIIERATAQTSALVISTSPRARAYQYLGLPLLPDEHPDYAGPLAGICSAMRWYRHHQPWQHRLACFPGDVPVFPRDIVTTLCRPIPTQNPEVVWLQTGEQLQPLFSVWSMDLLSTVEQALAGGVYSPKSFITSRRHILVDTPPGGPEQYLNINTPDDLNLIHSLLTPD